MASRHETECEFHSQHRTGIGSKKGSPCILSSRGNLYPSNQEVAYRFLPDKETRRYSKNFFFLRFHLDYAQGSRRHVSILGDIQQIHRRQQSPKPLSGNQSAKQTEQRQFDRVDHRAHRSGQTKEFAVDKVLRQCQRLPLRSQVEHSLHQIEPDFRFRSYCTGQRTSLEQIFDSGRKKSAELLLIRLKKKKKKKIKGKGKSKTNFFSYLCPCIKKRDRHCRIDNVWYFGNVR